MSGQSITSTVQVQCELLAREYKDRELEARTVQYNNYQRLPRRFYYQQPTANSQLTTAN
ncbi:hypothetical protein QT971_26865 [Microcoleus sp. herbarium19]